MIDRRRLVWLSTAALTLAALAFAGFIVADTLRAVVPLWSPLPWLDEWASVWLLRSWQAGEVSAAQALVSQHNEHRLVVPRLFFLADDLLVRGRGTLLLGCIFAVQALHAGLFAAAFGRARPRAAGRWAVAAVILAMMFSLRQEQNFTSGFQIQFVGVFAGATLTFALFALALGRARAGRASAPPLLGCLAAALATAFTMANGLAAAWVVVALAAAARAGGRLVLLCAAWAALITAAYLWGYERISYLDDPIHSLAHPLALLVYAATYLGGVIGLRDVGVPAGFGFVGIALAACAAWRGARRGGDRPAALAMVGVMLFAGAAAVVTGSGRLSFGPAQALSTRYATGSVAFWAAQLAYWWIDPPRGAVRLRSAALPAAALARGAVALVAAALCVALSKDQSPGRAEFIVQSFAQSESANLLMLGLDDPAVVGRAAWNDGDVQRLLPTLKADGLSIFGTADHAGLWRPATDRAPLGAPCTGAVEAAAADPSLGPGGVRVSGRALDGHRILRRVLLADADGRVVGLASGAVPGAARDAWRGFAVAAPGAALTAYGLADGRRLCRIGEATVAAGAARP